MLKRLAFALSFLCLSTNLNAYEFTDFDQAFNSAKANNKLLLVVGVAQDCRYCHIFYNNLHADPRWAKYSSQFDWAFVDIAKNIEMFVKFFQIKSTPTTYILIPSKMDYYVPEIVGAADVNELFRYIDAVWEKVEPKLQEFDEFNKTEQAAHKS